LLISVSPSQVVKMEVLDLFLCVCVCVCVCLSVGITKSPVGLFYFNFDAELFHFWATRWNHTKYFGHLHTGSWLKSQYYSYVSIFF